MIQESSTAFAPFPGISEQVYSQADFKAICELIYAESAIVLPTGKSTLVYSRLAPLVRDSGAGTFSNYIARIKQDDRERHKAVCALTTNHTGFFREEHHFDHFRDHVRPQMLHDLSRGGSVRMWSAGSSSGEEVYSLAMTLLGKDRAEARRIASSDVAILASDIADHALIKGRNATYDLDGLASVPDDLRGLWVENDGRGQGRIMDLPRELVRFRSLNLMGAWPMKRPFEVIFCRNVMIYFDQPTREKLIDRYVDHLRPGGYLYIGHSERVTGPAQGRVELVGKTIYRKLD